MAIIKSLLDTDLYKITMMYAIFVTCHRMGIKCPIVQYGFKCRNQKNLAYLKNQIVKEIEEFKKLRFTKNDVKYLMSLGLFEEWFADALLSINLNDVHVAVYEAEGELKIDIAGRWVPAILFEVPILSIVNELYFKDFKAVDMKNVGHKNLSAFVDTGHKNLTAFVDTLKAHNITFSDFGTRRRFSREWQDTCVKYAKIMGVCTSTSNVYLAKKYGIAPVGTMAHEWLQAFQVLSCHLRDFQKDALNHWMLTYRGKLSTALTDIIGIDAFLKDWDTFFANNYSTLRHDSGCPYEFIDKVYKWYRAHNLRQMPRLLFSDGLTPQTCIDIKTATASRNIDILFGIGTNFTNNVGLEPLQIVIKLTKVNGEDVVKISDSAGKAMNNNKGGMYQRLKETFNLKG